MDKKKVFSKTNIINFVDKLNLPKIVSSYWFMILLLIPFFVPLAFRYLHGLSYLYELCKYSRLMIFVAIVIVIAYKFVFKKEFINIYLCLVLFFELSILASTIANKQPLSKCVGNITTIFSICYIADCYLKSVNIKKFVNSLFYIYLILNIANLFVVIFFNKGLTGDTTNPMYLLAEDNTVPIHNILFVALVAIKAKLDNNVKWLSLLIIPASTFILIDSATNKAIVLVLIVGLFFLELVKLKVVNTKVIIAVASVVICAMFACVVIRSLSDQVFAIIGKLLNRNSTFTGRTILWDISLEKIKDSPLFGYGDYQNHIAIWDGYFSAHNYYLEILLDGGFVAFAAFLAILYMALKKCFNSNSQISKILTLCAFAILLYFFVQIVDQATVIFIVFTLGYNLTKIEEQTNQANLDKFDRRWNYAK